jgi:hypothetical protein
MNRVAWQKFTDTSDKHCTSIFRVDLCWRRREIVHTNIGKLLPKHTKSHTRRDSNIHSQRWGNLEFISILDTVSSDITGVSLTRHGCNVTDECLTTVCITRTFRVGVLPVKRFRQTVWRCRVEHNNNNRDNWNHFKITLTVLEQSTKLRN